MLRIIALLLISLAAGIPAAQAAEKNKQPQSVNWQLLRELDSPAEAMEACHNTLGLHAPSALAYSLSSLHEAHQSLDGRYFLITCAATLTPTH